MLVATSRKRPFQDDIQDITPPSAIPPVASTIEQSVTLTLLFDKQVPLAIGASAAIQIPDWSAAAKTTIPALIVTDFILGLTPTSAKLQSLAEFALTQYNSYAAAGVSDPSIGPFEALGLGLSKTPELSANFGSGSDTSFVLSTYREAFDRDANISQVVHFQSQLTYFKELYLGVGIDLTAATLGARGAVVGQMLGFAAAESGNAYSEAAQMLLLNSSNGGTVRPVNLLGTYGINESGSPGTVVANNFLTTFVATTSTVDFKIDGALFSGIAADFQVYLNGVKVNQPVAFSADKSHLLISNVLQNGPNDISMFGFDNQGHAIKEEAVVWAGSNFLTVRVVDKNGQPVVGASLLARLTEANDVFESAVSDQNGMITFANLPNRNITIEGEQGSLFGAIGALGGQSSTTLVLLPLNAPSPIINDDFAIGFDGWDVGGSPVTLEDHQEGIAAPLALSASPEARFSATDTYALTSNAPIAAAATSLNKDMVLSTRGEGPQTIHRGFIVQPGAEVVTLRYKFITSEIPAHYSEANSTTTIPLRSATRSATGFP